MKSFRSRCALVSAVTCAACALGAIAPASAQKYPVQQVRVIVPTSPGGAVDSFGRGISRTLQQSFGVSSVVENRAGASGAIGAELVSKAAPDGSTLLVIWGGHVINPLITKGLPYDAIRDFTPVIRIGNIPLLLVVHPSVPATSVKALVALAKAKPGMLAYASGGVGSGGHLSGALLQHMTGIDMLHIPYKGNSAAHADLLGGHVSVMFDTITTGLPNVQKGKLRSLAVTSAERTQLAPSTPTMIESGFAGFETDAWYALLGPGKMPRQVTEMLNAEINKAFNNPAFRDPFVSLGVKFVGGSPEQLESHMRSEMKRWSEVLSAIKTTAK